MNDAPIYLDHNASTPTAPEVIEAMVDAMRKLHANPSSIEHLAGNAAHAAIEVAREQIAQTIRCLPKETVFTSGSTEANGLALRGTYPRLAAAGRPHIVTTDIEHPSVLENARYLERQGASVTYLGVDESGRVDVAQATDAIGPETGLVSVMAANNETGVLQPIDEIGKICEEAGALFHTDYSQATAYVPLDLQAQPIHLASFSGHKAYGPKGAGVLYLRARKPRVRLEPILFGGGQERGLRSGTLNTPGIVGLGVAFELVRQRIEADISDISGLRNQLSELLLRIPGARLNGDCAHRLANTLSFSIEGIEPLALMHITKGQLIFSASSACATDKVETSHVLKAMFGEGARAREAFRLGLGRDTSHEDIEITAEVFEAAAVRLRTP